MPNYLRFTLCLFILMLNLANPSFACAEQLKKLEQVQKTAFPEADSFVDAKVTLSAEQIKSIASSSGVRVRLNQQAVWQAMANQKKIGWLIVDEVYGKHEFITYSVALNNDGSVKLIEVMDYRETHGGQVQNAAWLQQFVGKMFGAAFKLDEDIKNISGATLSCKHMADGVKRLMAFYKVALVG